MPTLILGAAVGAGAAVVAAGPHAESTKITATKMVNIALIFFIFILLLLSLLLIQNGYELKHSNGRVDSYRL
jgi:drug/metabolite transporter (DMT)-like permease